MRSHTLWTFVQISNMSIRLSKKKTCNKLNKKKTDYTNQFFYKINFLLISSFIFYPMDYLLSHGIVSMTMFIHSIVIRKYALFIPTLIWNYIYNKEHHMLDHHIHLSLWSYKQNWILYFSMFKIWNGNFILLEIYIYFFVFSLII